MPHLSILGHHFQRGLQHYAESPQLLALIPAAQSGMNSLSRFRHVVQDECRRVDVTLATPVSTVVV